MSQSHHAPRWSISLLSISAVLAMTLAAIKLLGLFGLFILARYAHSLAGEPSSVMLFLSKVIMSGPTPMPYVISTIAYAVLGIIFFLTVRSLKKSHTTLWAYVSLITSFLLIPSAPHLATIALVGGAFAIHEKQHQGDRATSP